MPIPKGYWNNEAATRESFAPGGWFRTGDLATVNPQGYISVVDRKKDMILVGGENVYCTEVEAVLHAHPLVSAAAVFGIPSAVMGELVAAAVVLKAAAPASIEMMGKGGSESQDPPRHLDLVTGLGGSTLALSPQQVASELTEWCRSRLAHYKVPHQVSASAAGWIQYSTAPADQVSDMPRFDMPQRIKARTCPTLTCPSGSRLGHAPL